MKITTNIFFVAAFVLAPVLPALGQWSPPVPVIEVNTEYEEWTPFLSFDGLSLYFARVRTDTFYYGRIFKATREEPFGPFTSVEEVFQSRGHVFSPWVSPDNLRMYYHNEVPEGWLLKVSERASAEDPWPDGVPISELNALGQFLQYPRLTPDELTICFSGRNLPGGQGLFDIWMATRPNRTLPFDEIWNLEELNTAAHDKDASVSISSDGLTVVFSSDRNVPYNFQLFMARREHSDEPFGEPEHLAFFDSPGGGSKHPFLTPDGSTLYFMKDLSSSERDIWVSYLQETVSVDIKPAGCPNPLNLKSNGLLPVAVLGSEDLDVSAIDAASIRLAGIAPIRSSLEDVAAPVTDGNECACTTEGPDGYTDLILKFKTPRIVEALVSQLGELVDGEVLVLPLAGALSDHTLIEGQDCVVVRGKVPKPIAAKRSDINADGIVNILDLAMMTNYWLQYAIVEY